MTLNIIDLSRYQATFNIATSGANGCITGCTYGTAGVNPYAAAELNATKAAGLLRGAYHIRAGDGPTYQAEAEAFIAFVTPYIDGKTVLILDWEECTLTDTAWALGWLNYVFAKTGIRPIIYMSSSASLQGDWGAVIAAGYALWVAQYPYSSCVGFPGALWIPPATGWPAIIGWQYCSGATLGNYVGIDVSAFYLTPAQWVAFATPITTTDPTEDDLSAAEVNQILAAITASTAAVNAQTNALLVYGYMSGGVKHPGGNMVAEENQRRINAANTGITGVPAAVKAVIPAATVSLTDTQVQALAAQLGPANIKALAAQLNK